MQIDRPGVGLPEQIIFDLCRPKFRIHVRLVFAEKTTVLGFDSNDPFHSNQITRRMATWLSQKESPHLHPPQTGRGQSHNAISRAKKLLEAAVRLSLCKRERIEVRDSFEPFMH